MYGSNLRLYVDDEGNLTQEGILILDRREENTKLKYEGREMILFLGIPISLGVEAWRTLGRWFVQQNDGIRAVSQNIWFAINDEIRSKLDLPLDEMVEKIKRASRGRIWLTAGRIGRDPGLPMLVTDAYELRDFYTSVGAVYEGEGATVLPPPAPRGG